MGSSGRSLFFFSTIERSVFATARGSGAGAESGIWMWIAESAPSARAVLKTSIDFEGPMVTAWIALTASLCFSRSRTASSTAGEKKQHCNVNWRMTIMVNAHQSRQMGSITRFNLINVVRKKKKKHHTIECLTLVSIPVCCGFTRIFTEKSTALKKLCAFRRGGYGNCQATNAPLHWD